MACRRRLFARLLAVVVAAAACATTVAVQPDNAEQRSAVRTNLPLLSWQSRVPAAANSSAFRIRLKSGGSVYSDSGWSYRENPHLSNCTTWPVAATTYSSAPPLAPGRAYTWEVAERHPAAGSGPAKPEWRPGGSFATSAALPAAAAEAGSAAAGPAIRRLFGGQLENLLARLTPDGYLSTSGPAAT